MLKNRDTIEKNLSEGKDPKIKQWSDELLSDEELLLRAIPKGKVSFQDNETPLDFIPKEYRTKRVLLKSIETYPSWMIIGYLPEELKDKGVWKMMLINTPKGIGPYRKRIINAPPEFIAQIPKDYLRDDTFLYEVITKNPSFIAYLDKDLITDKLAAEAVSRSPFVITFIPEHLRSRKLCTKAVTINGKLLRYVPEIHHSEELYRAAIKSNPMCLAYIPEYNKTYDICMEAVKELGRSLYHVPSKYMDYDMCLAAVKSYPEVITRIDPKLPPNLETKSLLTKEEYETLQKEAVKTALKNAMDEDEADKNTQINGDTTVIANTVAGDLHVSVIPDRIIKEAVKEIIKETSASRKQILRRQGG